MAAALGACKPSAAPQAPLPPDLAAIHCPADRNGHTRALIGKAEVTLVCFDPQARALPPGAGPSAPDILRCDRASSALDCAATGEILLSHDADGMVYSETVPDYALERDNHGPESGPTDDSQLHLVFHAGPPARATFDPVETPYRFLLPGADGMLPDGFTFVKGTLCDRQATVLDTGVCNLEATTPSLYWHISISLHHKAGTPIYDHEYRSELAFWMKYLGLMVTDPKA